ncbi:glycosyltransferase [Pontixanthobacter gangjinensis]|uniref:Glycosyltransferase n=1 Tax=Christiangramia aestuarii TaxID=1028746 RepID=A0A7M3SWS8_9FLAO|nr:glycosyltransferase [Christiangramia aestuarii]MUP41059.1 glycosyltransferase [Christiangramia aestuarii]
MEEKKSVLFIIDTLEVGGAERSILEIASRFSKYLPIVVTLFEGDALKQDYINRGIEVISLDFKSNTDHQLIINRLQGILDDIDPKIIHATLLRSCLISRALKRRESVKLINSLVNNTYGFQRYRTLSLVRATKLFYTQLRDLMSVSKVDYFFSNSETIKNTSARALRIDTSKIKVIYRGRDPEGFINVDADALRKDLKKFDETLYTCVGRLIERKGQLDLVAAFAEHLEKHPNSKLVLVGEGPLRKDLEAKITALNLKEKILLLGQRNDIPEILSLTDYFIFPSYYEGLPGALVEAMFSKTPIIASGIPENLECVDQDTSIIFSPGNVKDLVEKLELALHSDWLRKTVKGFEKAIHNFSINHIVKEYELTYDMLLEK